MAKVLFIKGTPQSEEQSRSMKVTRTFIDEYKKVNPMDEVIELDVNSANIPFIDADYLSAQNKLRSGESLTDTEAQKLAKFNVLIEQFIGADKYIIQSSMWNLGLQPLLKAYFDAVMYAGKTYKYTAEGVAVGLLKGKKAIHIIGMGGLYSNLSGVEHSDSYVKHLFGFVGVEMLPTIYVEGIDQNPTQKEEIITTASEKAKAVAQTF